MILDTNRGKLQQFSEVVLSAQTPLNFASWIIPAFAFPFCGPSLRKIISCTRHICRVHDIPPPSLHRPFYYCTFWYFQCPSLLSKPRSIPQHKFSVSQGRYGLMLGFNHLWNILAMGPACVWETRHIRRAHNIPPPSLHRLFCYCTFWYFSMSLSTIKATFHTSAQVLSFTGEIWPDARF